MPEIAACAFSVAPERARDLQKLRESYGIKLEAVDEPRFGIRVDPLTGTVKLPVAALEYLWACAHLFVVVYQENVKAQASSRSQLQFHTNPNLQRAEALFGWAKRNLNGDGKAMWPSGLPTPEQRLQNADLEFITHLFLIALAWIIHHEVAHVTQRHTPGITSRSLTEENGADRVATDWILGDRDPNAQDTLKRGLGIATAILTLQSLEIRQSTMHGPETHAPAQERLHRCLGGYQIGSEQGIEAYTVSTLQVLYDELGIRADINGNSFQDIQAGLLVEKSRLDRQ